MTIISTCEFFSGWVAGIAALAVGYPMDTIKVRTQIAKGGTIVGNIVSTYRVEGVRGFYKGMVYPLMSAGVLNSLFFGVYGNALRHMVYGSFRTFCCEEERQTVRNQNFWHLKVATAGAIGGIATVIPGCPIDCVKTRMQGNRETNVTGWTVTKKLIKESGIRGVYRGFTPMIFREAIGNAAYILTYEHVACTLEGTIHSDKHTAVRTEIVSGGVAGSVSWMVSMPFDVVKTRMQWDDPADPKYRGMRDCFYQSFKREGYSVFMRGVGIALIRSFPVNSINFLIYQRCMKNCNSSSAK